MCWGWTEKKKMSPEALPFLTNDGLASVWSRLDEAETPQEFLEGVDKILEDPRSVVTGSVDSWPVLVKNEDDDGENAVALWRHTVDSDAQVDGFTRSQASDGRFWTYMAFSHYRNYMLERWPLISPRASNWKGRVEDRWIMPAEPGYKQAIRHGIARLWWIPCLTEDDGDDDMPLTRWILRKERLVIDLLDRYVTMSEPTRYAVLNFVMKSDDVDDNRRRAFIKELNNIAGVRDLDSMSEHERYTLLHELMARV